MFHCNIFVFSLLTRLVSVERSFHERIMPSLRNGVEHITIYSHLPPLEFSGLSKEISLDSHSIQSSCSDMLAELSDPSAYFPVAVAIKSNGCSGPAAKVDLIQFQISKKVYILQVGFYLFSVSRKILIL
jgi:hypothetical protein